MNRRTFLRRLIMLLAMAGGEALIHPACRSQFIRARQYFRSSEKIFDFVMQQNLAFEEAIKLLALRGTMVEPS